MKSYILAALFALGASGASAATIQNGSFEAPGTFNGTFATLFNGNTSINGWTVGGHSVDLINTYWQNSDGNYSLDMSGNAAGAISTTITGLIAGTVYNVMFDLAANPDGGPLTKLLRVMTGATTEDFSVLQNVGTKANMNWATQTFTFTAGASSQLLTFESLAQSAFGPALDNVSIVAAVPLPATAPLALLGFGAIAALRRRKSA